MFPPRHSDSKLTIYERSPLLNYMATLEPLAIKAALLAKVLETVPMPSWETRMPVRPLYATPDLLDWVEEYEPLHTESVADRTLYDHLWQMFADFRCSARPGGGDLKRVMPQENGVWKMHPPKLRIFGWCPFPHSFAAVSGVLESETKNGKGITTKKREDVLAFIKAHKLEQAFFIGEYLETFPNKQP
jgi:hypothetical protein